MKPDILRCFAQAAHANHLSDTEIAGRYVFQAEAEQLILPDVVAKLAIGLPTGSSKSAAARRTCSFPWPFAATATGIDNEPAIAWPADRPSPKISKVWPATSSTSISATAASTKS